MAIFHGDIAMRDRKSNAHRARTERELGRPLTPDEVVHHLDEDKANNDASNRQVKRRSQHTSDHNKARPLSRLRKALTADKRGEKLY